MSAEIKDEQAFAEKIDKIKRSLDDRSISYDHVVEELNTMNKAEQESRRRYVLQDNSQVPRLLNLIADKVKDEKKQQVEQELNVIKDQLQKHIQQQKASKSKKKEKKKHQTTEPEPKPDRKTEILELRKTITEIQTTILPQLQKATEAMAEIQLENTEPLKQKVEAEQLVDTLTVSSLFLNK